MNPAPGPEVSPSEILAEVERILASSHFAASERMSRFLRCIVKAALEGRTADLKEYTIGVDVFDRPANYDPRIDPIVRVEARRLRSKLDAWYCANGSGPFRIELPKGSYVPRFTRNPAGMPSHAKVEKGIAVAVLPFTNSSADAEASYLSDGLTQQIIQLLTRVPDLRVLGWNSASQMRERRDLPNVAHELNASHVLTGSVRQMGDRLRTFAQLVDARTGAFVWSNSWDRKAADLFRVEEEIASAIVNALGLHLGIDPVQAREPDACDLYYRARHAWDQRTVEGMRESVALLRRTVSLSPDFALAWAGLADSYVIMAQVGLLSPAQAIQPARHAAERALELKPDLGEAEASLGLIVALHDWDWNTAELHFQRAMTFSPGYSIAFFWYALDYCANRRYFREAEAALAEAELLDPLSSNIRIGRPYLLMLERRYDEALRLTEQTAELDPEFARTLALRGRVLVQLGEYKQAVDWLSRALDMQRIPGTMGALGQARALAGDLSGATEILNELRALSQRQFVQSSCIAAVLIGMKRFEEAVAVLEEGAAQRQLSISGIGAHPLYDPLRGIPAFDRLVERVGS